MLSRNQGNVGEGNMGIILIGSASSRSLCRCSNSGLIAVWLCGYKIDCCRVLPITVHEAFLKK